MSDIDFDELDKAVNSLMQPKDEGQADQSTTSTESTDADVSQSNEPTVSAVNTTPPPRQSVEASSTSTPQPSLATRRRGKFMDVMHPGVSATGKPSASAQGVIRVTPSRRGVSLQPTTDEVEPEASSTSIQSAATTVGAEVSSPESTPDMSVMGSLSGVDNKTDIDMPDPLDVEALSAQDDTADPTASSDLEFTQPDPLDIAAELESAAGASEAGDSVVASPFLPDAKVEKRPLGAVETTDKASDDVTDEGGDVDTAKSDEAKSDELLPKELEASLMSLEGHSTSKGATSVEKSDTVAQEAATTPKVLASPSKPLAVKDSPSTSSALPSRTPTAPVDADAEDTAKSSIFDTTEHDTLKHQAKHSTGWYTLVILAGMAVIGILGGVLFYFMTNSA